MNRRLAVALVAALAMFTACGQDNSPTASAAPDTVAVSKNPGMADATPSNPTGAPGDRNVLVASFMVSIPAGARVQAYGTFSRLYDPKLGSTYTLGDVFTSLRLRDSETGDQVGEAITTLGFDEVVEVVDPLGFGLTNPIEETGERTYAFIPAPYYGLDQPSRVQTLNLYADIRPDAVDNAVEFINNNSTSGVVTPVVSVYFPSGETEIAWVQGPMQKLYITH